MRRLSVGWACVAAGLEYETRKVLRSLRVSEASCHALPSTDHCTEASVTRASTGPRLSKVSGKDTRPAGPTLFRLVGGTYDARRIGTTASFDGTANCHQSDTRDESSWFLLPGVVVATSRSCWPGLASFTNGDMVKLPWSRRSLRLTRSQVALSVKPNCCVPADVISDRFPVRSPFRTQSEQKKPVRPCSRPRSATGVTGPRKNGTCACSPRRYVEACASCVKLRKLRLRVVMLCQAMFLLPRNIACTTPGRTVGKSSMNANESAGLNPKKPSSAFCCGPVA